MTSVNVEFNYKLLVLLNRMKTLGCTNHISLSELKMIIMKVDFNHKLLVLLNRMKTLGCTNHIFFQELR